MKIGLHLDASKIEDAGIVFAEWLAMATMADAAGIDYLSVVDHIVPFPPHRPRDVPTFDPWQVLSALALTTERIQLLPLVSNGSLHHPVTIAKRAATLDVVSRGRMLLGLGAGGHKPEEQALNLGPRSFAQRYGRLSECIELVMELLSGQPVSYAGRWYELDGYTSQPALNRPLELVIAGASRQILELVVAHKAHCNFAFAEPHSIGVQKEQLASINEGWAGRIGEITVLDRIFVAADTEQAEAAWEGAGQPIVNGHPGIIGDPATVQAQIRALHDVGVTTLFCMFPDRRGLSLFIEHVLPALSTHATH